MQATRNGDFGVILVFERELPGRVVFEGERDLGKVVRRSRLAPVEDDILHRPPAKMAGALLAHAPSDGIHDVGLAAPVGPNDTQDVMVEV